MENYTLEKCNEIVKLYGFSNICEMKMIDSSHGDEDIRHNYILDKKYVLRVNSAKIFSEDILNDLNLLIKRYRDFGVQAPLFLNDINGTILHQDNNIFYYMSEYLDGMIPPDELTEEQTSILVKERLIMIAAFAEKYKNKGLFPFMSMYSLFELSPYDELIGIDEKQDNLNQLVQALKNCEEVDMANKLENINNSIRKQLLEIFKELPRCVFQGDENWGNMIVDENYHIQGLFDFNMAGTDVIVNYFANNALLVPGFLDEEYMNKLDAKEIFQETIKAFQKNTDVLKKHYSFSETELYAYKLYARIVLISSYPNVSAFQYFLKNEKYKEKTIHLLNYFADEDWEI